MGSLFFSIKNEASPLIAAILFGLEKSWERCVPVTGCF